jgi:hypothetical protein
MTATQRAGLTPPKEGKMAIYNTQGRQIEQDIYDGHRKEAKDTAWGDIGAYDTPAGKKSELSKWVENKEKRYKQFKSYYDRWDKALQKFDLTTNRLFLSNLYPAPDHVNEIEFSLLCDWVEYINAKGFITYKDWTVL